MKGKRRLSRPCLHATFNEFVGRKKEAKCDPPPPFCYCYYSWAVCLSDRVVLFVQAQGGDISPPSLAAEELAGLMSTDSGHPPRGPAGTPQLESTSTLLPLTHRKFVKFGTDTDTDAIDLVTKLKRDLDGLCVNWTCRTI